MYIFAGAKTGDYHNDMNNENFMKWVNDQLLPNMPEKSVLVVDNASYHNVPIKLTNQHNQHMFFLLKLVFLQVLGHLKPISFYKMKFFDRYYIYFVMQK